METVYHVILTATPVNQLVCVEKSKDAATDRIKKLEQATKTGPYIMREYTF